MQRNNIQLQKGMSTYAKTWLNLEKQTLNQRSQLKNMQMAPSLWKGSAVPQKLNIKWQYNPAILLSTYI